MSLKSKGGNAYEDETVSCFNACNISCKRINCFSDTHLGYGGMVL